MSYLFMGLRRTKDKKTVLENDSSCAICVHISVAIHITDNSYDSGNTVR